MPLVNEKMHVPAPDLQDPPDEQQEEKPKPIKIRVSLYYDGTQNNRANTNVRKNVERGQAKDQTDSDVKANRELFAKYGKKDGSYDNDESNVSRLEGQSTNTCAGYDHYFHVYVEGIGTVDKGKDHILGLALGKDPKHVFWGEDETGIIAKVEAGIVRALNLIRQKIKSNGKVEIEELALDTLGFSRGAAAARYAIHRASNDEKDRPLSLKSRLEGGGFKVKKLKVLAVGLFDTVSSFGLGSEHKTNVKTLKLDSIRDAKAVLQLAAAEEYRDNFKLTTIESARNGRQVFLPGAHSDVGGCYEDGLSEDKDLYGGEAAKDIAKFLLDRGWYTKQQLQLQLRPVDIHAVTTKDYVRVKRSGLLKEYSYIPLHLMADFAKEQGLDFVSDLEETFKIKTIDSALAEEIKRYGASKKNSQATDWEVPREDLNKLRNKYLHVPYSTGIGMGPSLLKSGGYWNRSYRPHRETFSG